MQYFYPVFLHKGAIFDKMVRMLKNMNLIFCIDLIIT